MDRERFDDPAFWDGMAEYGAMAHPFTALFADRALREADLPRRARILDVATGSGALAVAAAHAGARVLATDFSAGMTGRVQSLALPNIEVARMDGQALELPDAMFDAAFSMFGVTMFPNWRKGLAEMARVTRPGGTGCVGTWKDSGGAATNLLLCRLASALFLDVAPQPPIGGLSELADPGAFRAALETAGFEDVRIVEDTHDFILTPDMMADPDRLFGFSSTWKLLDAGRREVVFAAISGAMRDQALPVPSTALIAVGRRV